MTDNRQAKPAVTARTSIALEDLKAAPHQLLTYHFWAEDLDAAGKKRRAGGDLYFAELRPFEERFREGPPGGQAEMGGAEQNSPAGQLTRTQKDVMNANWRVERDARGGRPREELRPDIETLSTAQKGAKDKAETMRAEVRDPVSLGGAGRCGHGAWTRPWCGCGPPPARTRSARWWRRWRPSSGPIAALLRLAERERTVTRGRGGGGGGGRSGDMPELSNLELKQKDSRYETRREAASAQQRAGGGDRETLSRLQELARRQKALTERLREAQAALKPRPRKTRRKRSSAAAQAAARGAAGAAGRSGRAGAAAATESEPAGPEPAASGERPERQRGARAIAAGGRGRQPGPGPG